MPKGKSTIVQSHTSGEFQPVQTPLVASNDSQVHRKDEYSQSASKTIKHDSEIVLATIQYPLHQSVDSMRDVEEAYVSPAQENRKKEQEPDLSYPTWDART
jgi:glycogenin glucosyltransferase